MRAIIRALKTVDYRLFAAIFATMLLPTIYQTVRIFWLGDLPSENGINIASQLSWVNLFYEVVQEALILPLFFLLGKSLSDRREFENKVRTGIVVTAAIYLTLSIFLIIFARPLILLMAQDKSIIEETVVYVRLETVAALFSTLWRFMTLVLVTLKKDGYLYIALGIQTALSVIFDIFFVSSLPVSFGIGVNGIALTNIIVNAAIFTVAIFLLKKENINLFVKEKWSFSWLKEWFKVGKFSGLESLLRNLSFSVMVIRMVNLVAEQGNYWIANNFIWQWLLLPALALADLAKKEIGESKNNVRGKTFGYLCLTAIFAILWFLSIPLWKPFLKYAMNAAEYETVMKIVLIETPFYITYLFNCCIFDSTFYGLGKTNYMFLQSVCVDGVYYGVLFVLYLTGIFVPSLLGICLMFGIGMALDFIPALFLYLRVLKKEGLKIDFRLEGCNFVQKAD